MLPKMNHADRMKRADDKKIRLLSFLADHEVYTSCEIAAQVMGVSRRRATDMLARLERNQFLRSEVHMVVSRQLRLYGITPHGLAAADADPDAPFFELGRTNSSWIQHKLNCQALRFVAERAGCEWMPERKIHHHAKVFGGWKKIPDGFYSTPAGLSIAVEVERFAKTPKRYREIIISYMQMDVTEIHYVSPPGVSPLIKSSFSKCRNLPEGWEKKFKFFDFGQWDPLSPDSNYL